MVSLTGLLVEATFFSQVSATIPHTAYLKLVDTWFVFCILFLFLVVVALVIINWLQEESKVQPMQAWTLKDTKVMLQARATRFNTFCRLAFPMFASSFLVVYYITAAV
ncbi:uncharacterized protein [Panulirus ornatus]|uniref:uncharacterized protein n=1 Tax=Panulirus ornatus TaxID=150431 RepID=UPI003A84F9E8